MPIVDVAFILDRLTAMFVGGTIAQSASHSPTCHPGRVPFVVVIPTVPILGIGCAAKLTSPDDQCLIQKPPLLEIREQPSNRLIDLAALIG